MIARSIVLVMVILLAMNAVSAFRLIRAQEQEIVVLEREVDELRLRTHYAEERCKRENSFRL